MVYGSDSLTDVDSALESGDIGEIFKLLSLNWNAGGWNSLAYAYYAVKLASNLHLHKRSCDHTSLKTDLSPTNLRASISYFVK